MWRGGGGVDLKEEQYLTKREEQQLKCHSEEHCRNKRPGKLRSGKTAKSSKNAGAQKAVQDEAGASGKVGALPRRSLTGWFQYLDFQRCALRLDELLAI